MNQFSDPPNTHDCYSFFPLDLFRTLFRRPSWTAD